jgi:hypothetical protein
VRKKQFSVHDLISAILIAVAGYLANTFGLVNLPSPY